MNPSQYTSIGVSAAVLTPVIMWLFTWPIHAPTDAQAGGIAAILIAIAGGTHAAVRSYLAGRRAAVDSKAPVEPSHRDSGS